MTQPFDIAVIGGGHNGLTCAAYLAQAGRRVVVVEAAEQLGGAAITGEIAPGFKVSTCAHLLNQLHPHVIRDLKLDRHGLDYAAKDMSSIALGADGRHLTLNGETLGGSAEIPAPDRAAWPGFRARLLRFAGALAPFLAAPPPRLSTADRADHWSLARLGWAIRRLGRRDMREFLRIGAINVADLLEETFESDLLKGAVAFDAVLGNHLGPRSPGSVLTLLYRLCGRSDGVQGALGLPLGGMGAVTAALARAAEAGGAELRCAAPVERVLVERDRAVGVALESGEEIAANCVVSSADPNRTFLGLLGSRHLDAGFVRRVRNIRMRGDAAKLNLALDGLPSFNGLDNAALGGRLVIAPGIGHLERAFDHAKYGEHSEAPAIEFTIPSIHDPGLAPEGKHVLSAVVLYAPYALKAGWETAREAFADRAIETLAAYAPDLPGKIAARQLLTPVDLERDFRMTGGHWHHGELAFDQIFMLRPVPGAAQYATPLPGLYLCGAGCHPGGGVTGAAGMNAARRVLAQETRP